MSHFVEWDGPVQQRPNRISRQRFVAGLMICVAAAGWSWVLVNGLLVSQMVSFIDILDALIFGYASLRQVKGMAEN